METSQDIQQCRVLVIGGGAAGLSAANHLIKNNINDIILLEGRNRLGGRIVAITISKYGVFHFLYTSFYWIDFELFNQLCSILEFYFLYYKGMISTFFN